MKALSTTTPAPASPARSTQTVITDELPPEVYVIAKMTDGDVYVIARTEEAAARGHAYLETAE